MTPAQLLARLSEIEAAATPGPWYEADGMCPRVCNARGDTVAAFKACYESCSIEIDEDDRLAIVAARNALPALLAVARAAEEVHQCFSNTDPLVLSKHGVDAERAILQLRAALAELAKVELP